ncbi:MAG: hypothetical protein CMJ76_13955 [Planctomycetaceae bacterium]|nr:hypothetical protein [Planctomycetaceae bacterium]|tara:strand:- start:1277 stop:2089 length:813 start_codon:yes stop_codon:yes gene_type:complete
MLKREEYIEQAYFFQIVGERLPQRIPLQDVILQVRDEVLATTKLPLALDYMLAELCHSGTIYPAMRQLEHYFTPFQTYLMAEAESDDGKFDLRTAVHVLKSEAEYRAASPTRTGLFMFQLECLCHNRLKYDSGLKAISEDPIYDKDWKEWILIVRRQIGIVDLADLIYVRSWHLANKQSAAAESEQAMLFGEQEGRIALANRQKEPLFLFAALQRQLGYPKVPRPKTEADSVNRLLSLERKVDQLVQRIKLVEDDARDSVDLSKFYKKPN